MAAVEINQLEQFVAVVKCGTISNAAQGLYISQPALSRSMQKLETELGVELFMRSRNRLELNENGKFAYELAENILKSTDAFVEQVRQFDRANRTIAIASCAPAPLWQMLPFLASLYPEKRLTSEVRQNELLSDGLKGGTYQIVISTSQSDDPEIMSIYAGKETLFLNVPKIHPLSRRKDGVRFADIEKYSILLYSHTGIWEDILRKNMPSAHVIMQENRDSFEALKRESSLLSFSTELSIKHYGGEENSVRIPVLDSSATLTYYILILKKKKDMFSDLIVYYADQAKNQ